MEQDNGCAIIDELIDLIIKEGFIIEEGDIAWIGIHKDQFGTIPGQIEYCNFRDWTFKVYKGLIFRQSQYATKRDAAREMMGCIAYNISKRSIQKGMFDWKKSQKSS